MRNTTVVSIVVTMFVMMFSTLAFGQTAGSTNLWSSIDEPGFHFSYDTSSAGGKTDFYANMGNSDRIASVSVSVNRDSNDPMHGWVNANFCGIVGEVPGAMEYQGQSMNIGRHGVQYSSNVGLSAYQEIISWPIEKDGEPIYGEWMSSANASVTLFDVTPTWANMNYSEYTDNWSNITYFNGNVQWQVEFSSESAARAYGSFGTTSVPEPATMSLLVIGGIASVIRRRRRQ
jgi:hypothetical protein